MSGLRPSPLGKSALKLLLAQLENPLVPDYRAGLFSSPASVAKPRGARGNDPTIIHKEGQSQERFPWRSENLIDRTTGKQLCHYTRKSYTLERDKRFPQNPRSTQKPTNVQISPREECLCHLFVSLSSVEASLYGKEAEERKRTAFYSLFPWSTAYLHHYYFYCNTKREPLRRRENVGS